MSCPLGMGYVGKFEFQNGPPLGGSPEYVTMYVLKVQENLGDWCVHPIVVGLGELPVGDSWVSNSSRGKGDLPRIYVSHTLLSLNAQGA